MKWASKGPVSLDENKEKSNISENLPGMEIMRVIMKKKNSFTVTWLTKDGFKQQ